MKKISYRVSIPKPCHEDWGKMSPEAKGRFCGACQKEVVDFASMSDEAVAETLKIGDMFCGRFKNNQLNRPIALETYLPRPAHWWSLILVAIWALFSSKSMANKLPSYEQTTEMPLKPNPGIDNYEKDSIKIILKGTVIDSSTGEPLVGAAVVLYSNGKRIKGTLTDLDGKFEIKSNIGDSLVLKCDYLGYKKQVITGISKSNQNLVVKMCEPKEEDLIISGMMMVVQTDSSDPRHIKLNPDSIIYQAAKGR